MIEAALKTIIEGDAAVSAIIAARVYPTRLPQGATLPAVSFMRENSPPVVVHHGGGVKVVAAAFMISCWAKNPLSLFTLAEAVRNLFRCYSGTVDGQQIIRSQIENDAESPGLEDDDFHRVITVLLVYKES